MAKKRPSIMKRQRERGQKERQEHKAQRRAQRRAEREAVSAPVPAGRSDEMDPPVNSATVDFSMVDSSTVG